MRTARPSHLGARLGLCKPGACFRCLGTASAALLASETSLLMAPNFKGL